MPKDLKTFKGRNRVHALLPGFLWEVAEVQTHGDTKYSPGNWKGGKDHPEEYIGAMMRHLLKYWAGETFDQETGFHHMAHITCSAMYLHWMDCGEGIPPRTCQCPVCSP